MPDDLSTQVDGVLTDTPIWQVVTIEKPTISVWAFRLWCFRIGNINPFSRRIPKHLLVLISLKTPLLKDVSVL